MHRVIFATKALMLAESRILYELCIMDMKMKLGFRIDFNECKKYAFSVFNAKVTSRIHKVVSMLSSLIYCQQFHLFYSISLAYCKYFVLCFALISFGDAVIWAYCLVYDLHLRWLFLFVY